MRPGRAILVGGEEAANRGTDAEHLEIVPAHHVSEHRRALRAGRDGQRHPAPRPDAVERARVVAQVGIARVRALFRDRSIAAGRLKRHQPCHAGDPGQRPEHHGVHAAEDRRHRAAAERNHEHHHQGEHGALAEHPAGKARVGEQDADRALPPVVAHLLADGRRAADFPSRGAPRLSGSEPARHVRLRSLVDVVLHLVVEVLVGGGPSRQHAKAPRQVAPE
jgi:hypothetical protein